MKSMPLKQEANDGTGSPNLESNHLEVILNQKFKVYLGNIDEILIFKNVWE